MRVRLSGVRRAAHVGRRQGAIVLLSAIVIAAFVALAWLSAIERRGDLAAGAQRAALAGAAAARVILVQQQRVVEALAMAAADMSEPSMRPPLAVAVAPGVRAAALFDPTGALIARSGSLDAATLAALNDAASSAALARPVEAQLSGAVRDARSGLGLVGLARAWFAADGAVGGTALIAVDRTAFAALGGLAELPAGGQVVLERADGTPLFREDAHSTVGAGRTAAIDGFPLVARYQPAAASPLPALLRWRLAVLTLGLVAALSLAGMLIRQWRSAARAGARRDAVEASLRDELAKLAAEIIHSDATSRSKSHFFAQVTHELRTPLNAILGFSETIRQEMFGPVANRRYRDYAGLIHDAGSHLLSLINDLLDSARIEAGKMEIAPIRVSAAALVRSALDLVERSAETRGIALRTSGLETCPDLNVDPRALKQVLVNLLGNAIKFTLSGGHVDIAFTARDDGGLAITVTDTGIGMSPEETRLAFEPFGRGGGSRARAQEGSGLGLSLARGLVRLHDGELTLASRLDAGTTATITLPKSAAFATGAGAPRLAPPKTAPPAAAA